MSIKNFKRASAKGKAQRLDYVTKLLEEARKPSLTDEAMSRALDSIYKPKSTTTEKWIGVVRLGILCATIVAVFWVLK